MNELYKSFHSTKNSFNRWTKISSLENDIFDLKMMVKNGLELFFKFTEPLQSCCCPVQKNLPRKAELAWQVSRYLWRGLLNFKIKDSRPFFTIIFKSKILIPRLEILVHSSTELVWQKLRWSQKNKIRSNRVACL